MSDADDDTGLSELFGDDEEAAAKARVEREDGDGVTHTHTLEVDIDENQIGVYDLQRHRNGDETVILLASFGGGYQALAMDVDAGGQILELEEIGDAEDDARVASQVEYWLDQNPDGVLGSAGAGEGLLERLGFGGGDGV
jgi:hypothetical protein